MDAMILSTVHRRRILKGAAGTSFRYVRRLREDRMRHANSRCALDFFAQARMNTKREAQQRVVKMILTEEPSEILLQRRGPGERLENIQ